MGLLDAAPRLAQAVREGQDRPVEREHGPRLVHRRRCGEVGHRRPGTDRYRGRRQRLHRHTGGEVGRQGVARVRHREPQLEPQPVHARRAGRAHLHRQDRRDRAVVRREAVRQHAGGRRSPSRRGVRSLPGGEAGWRVPGERAPAHAARRHRQRQPLGHDLLGHASCTSSPTSRC